MPIEKEVKDVNRHIVAKETHEEMFELTQGKQTKKMR